MEGGKAVTRAGLDTGYIGHASLYAAILAYTRQGCTFIRARVHPRRRITMKESSKVARQGQGVMPSAAHPHLVLGAYAAVPSDEGAWREGI